MFDLVRDIQSLSFWKTLSIVMILINTVLVWFVKILIDKAMDLDDMKDDIRELRNQIISVSSQTRNKTIKSVDIEDFRKFIIGILDETKNRKILDE